MVLFLRKTSVVALYNVFLGTFIRLGKMLLTVNVFFSVLVTAGK